MIRALAAGLIVLALLPWSAASASSSNIRAPIALETVHMVSQTAGWAVAGRPTRAIYTTTDGGQNWLDVLPAGVSRHAQFTATFLTAQRAWIAAFGPINYTTLTGRLTVYRTSDAGRHWSASTIARSPVPGGEVAQLDFTDALHGWLLLGLTPGMGHLVYALWRTSDGGVHWSKVAYDLERSRSTGAFPGCNCSPRLAFRNPTLGWVTGQPFATTGPWFYTTHNAGRTWRAQSLPGISSGAFPTTYPPTFVGNGTGFMPVQLTPSQPAITLTTYVTHDGGYTWRPSARLHLRNTSENRTLGFSFVRGGFGWIASGSRLLRTSDGGVHWTFTSPAGWTAAVTQIQFLNPTAGFALATCSTPNCAASRFLLRTTDGGRTWQHIPTYSASLPLH
jgi:photosystem II stability/assembly factor-like uncharacterized protein